MYKDPKVSIANDEYLMIEQGFSVLELTYDDGELGLEIRDVHGRKDPQYVFIADDQSAALCEWIMKKMKA